MIEVKKKEGEPTGSFLFRFNKKVKRSGVMKEVRKRKHRPRVQNKNKRRASAIYRVTKEKELNKEKKFGASPSSSRGAR